MFFVGTSGGPGRGLLAALLLTGVILLGVFLTFGVSRLLSGTLLRGVPSSFTLELPPYRRPRIGQVVVRSVLDRTLFVLGRAAASASPVCPCCCWARPTSARSRSPCGMTRP